MPGGFCSGSARSGSKLRILVCASLRDANLSGERPIVSVRSVHRAAMDPLKVLWDSQRWVFSSLFNKFNPPVIDGGQIYVPNYNGGVDLYRLVQ